MNTCSTFGFRSILRSLVAATLGLAAMLASPAAKAQGIIGQGNPDVTYNIPLQIVQGVVPFTDGYTLLITMPTTITASVAAPLVVTLRPAVVSAPAGVTAAQALSYLSLFPTTLNITAPGQTISVAISINIPAGIAGAFSYEIQTSLANVFGIVDNGAFINVTTTLPQSGAQLPVIQITQPVDQTVIDWNFSSGNLVIPYTIVGSTTDGSDLTGMIANVNGYNLGITPTGIGTPNAIVTGNFSVSAQGTYTVAATDTNVNGAASTTSTIVVNAIVPAPTPLPPSVVINTPTANSTYTMTGNTEVDVGFTSTGYVASVNPATDAIDGLTQLTATLDGVPLGITQNGLGSLTANGNGVLRFTTAGTHVLIVTATNNAGTATTSENLYVVQANVINLGAAANFTILTYNASNNSDSAFQCGPIGVVKGNWAQSGGQETNLQEATTVYLSSGYQNSGPSVENTVFNGTLLNSAWTAATSESATLAALKPTATLGSINANNSNTTIGGTAVGTYVYNFTNISLNHPANLIISASAGSTVIVNISGSVQLNGASGTGSMLITGGISNSNVIYNFTGSGNVLHTAGGGNGSVIQGTVLAPYGQVQIDPGEVDGQIIAQTFSTSSGTLVDPCQ